MAVRQVSRDEVAAFLAARHGTAVTNLELLQGGYWSAAFGYRADGRDLVVRFGEMRQGFEMDQAATAFARPHLPVPEVLEIGDAFERTYAISVRHRGRFVEDISVEDAPVAGGALARTHAALRAVPAEADYPSSWYPPGADPTESTWRRWLLDGLVDDPRRLVRGWRKMLADDPRLDRLFEVCQKRIGELADACPERRDLVHGDLLHQNVLIAEDCSRITAVFSWKCSVRGDFLFDVAWCTFWGAWHPGIAAVDMWNRTVTAPDLTGETLEEAPLRHHCYELQIGATHLGWSAWTGDRDSLRAVADHTARILDRGPLPSSIAS